MLRSRLCHGHRCGVRGGFGRRAERLWPIVADLPQAAVAADPHAARREGHDASSRRSSIRIFKAESELEVWKAKDDGRFYHFKTYPICNWSGGLGPKVKQGDRQAPEGFYLVSLDQMNPRSKYHLSFNLGFPNAYDRAYGRTGAEHHGAWRLHVGRLLRHDRCAWSRRSTPSRARRLQGGQPSFQVHAFPFRMTAANMAAHKDDKWYDFWRNLKEGYDYFEISRLPPKVAVCEKRYLVNVGIQRRRHA